MKKGFTLIELLAIIILLSLLFLLVYPKVLNISEKKEKEIDIAKQKLINNATLDYMNSNLNDYPQDVGAEYCFELTLLDNENLIPLDISDIEEYYNFIKVKIGVNHNYSYTLIQADSKEKCLEV